MPVLKECCRCGVKKSIKEFYKQSCGYLGRTGACKACRIKKQLEYQKTDNGIGLRREYERKMPIEEKRAKCKKFKKENPSYWIEYYRQNKKIRLLSNQKYQRNNLEKSNAHSKLYYAIKTKKINKPEECSICRSTGVLDGHHTDYSKPLEVIWVCRKCHTKIHIIT